MLMKWVILAPILSLALGLTLRDDKKTQETQETQETQGTQETQETQETQGTEWFRNVMKTIECCDTNKVIPPLFKKILNAWDCKWPIAKLFLRKNKPDGPERGCAMIECYLLNQDMLNLDRSVNEEELSDVLKDTANPLIKDLVQVAFDKCYTDYRDNPMGRSDRCKSGADLLIKCITTDLIMNCPQELWFSGKFTNKQCRHDKKD